MLCSVGLVEGGCFVDGFGVFLFWGLVFLGWIGLGRCGWCLLGCLVCVLE